jgi:DNA-binding NtrC family response regulator
MTHTATQPTPPESDTPARSRSFLTVALRADRPRVLPVRVCLDGVDEVRIVRGDTFDAVPRETGVQEIRIDDPSLSGLHFRLRQDGGAWWIDDARSRNGTMVDGRRIERTERTELRDGAVIEAGHTFLVFRRCATLVSGDTTYARDVIRTTPRGLATMHPVLEDRFTSLARITPSQLPVLIRGETGTGKELIARAVHQLSGRSGLLVAVNCASIPPDLLHAELFGARRGSYSGATSDRHGLARAADQGTLFFDEIAELSPRSQVTLLRLLQEREVVPLGGTQAISVDVRFIAATHADVHSFGFRADLLGRLSGFVIALPPLRERREDIGLLIASFLDDSDAAPDMHLSLPAARKLLLAAWLLNIRQLRHALSAAVLTGNRRLESEQLSFDDRSATSRSPEPAAAAPVRSSTARVSAAELGALLRTHAGNISAVARALSTSRTQVTRLMRRFGLDPAGNTVER